MGGRTWVRPVGEDAEARVTLDTAGSGDETRYRIEFPFLVGDESADDIQVTGAGTLEDHHLRSDAGLPVSDLEVSVPGDADLERLIVRSRCDRIVVHLPSLVLLETCDRTLDGDAVAADALIDRFPSPVQLPLLCGSFLGADDTVRLIQALVRHDRYVQSMLHSYRYAIVRSAVVDRTGLSVDTDRELADLVEGLDAIPEIGDVLLVDALADVMATVLDTPKEAEALLQSLGVDRERLYERDDGLFAACFLAHLACSDGVETALAYELPTKLPPRGHYDRRKRAVFQAEYGDRGTAWRRLLNAARRQSDEEVGQVLAHTLYWTGEESRSDARMGELLLRSAERVAAHTGQRKIELKARYKRLIAAGHRLRGTHCWGPSVANFEAARELAAGHPFLSEWEPILARGLVHSRGLSVDGDHKRAVGVLDETLEAYLATDPPTPVANRSVRHLTAQKAEIDAQRYRSEAPRLARHLLEEARAHYAALGFDRSREKVDRMLGTLPEAVTAGEPVEAPEPAEPLPADAGGLDGDADEATADGPGLELEAAAADDEDWLERIEYADEDEVRAGYEETFDDAYAL